MDKQSADAGGRSPPELSDAHAYNKAAAVNNAIGTRRSGLRAGLKILKEDYDKRKIRVSGIAES